MPKSQAPQSPARPTSPAPAPQAAPSPSSRQEAPHPAAAQRPKEAPRLERAPPRPAGSSHQAEASAPRENPFATQARAERRKSAVDSLARTRGQGEAKGPTPEGDGAAPPSGDVQAAQDWPDGPAKPATPPAQASGDDTALSILKRQMEEREAGVRAAEAKVKEAHTQAEKRAAQAEAREAKAEAHLKRLEMLRSDPAQFLAEAQITEDEWKRYWASGGKQTGEQQRLSENEKALAAMREEMAQVRAEAKAEVASLRREREDAEFARELSKIDYTLVREMGGLPAVRAKQTNLRETLGKDVTLTEAAGQLEHEWRHGFKELLKRDNVRATLGLDAATPGEGKTPSSPEPSRSASPRTLNGSLSSTTSRAPERVAWNDWRGKKERVLRELARARGN